MNVQRAGVGGGALQRRDQDAEDDGDAGGRRRGGGGDAGGGKAEEPAAAGALRVAGGGACPCRRRFHAAGHGGVGLPPVGGCRAGAGGPHGDGVVLPHVRLLLLPSSPRVITCYILIVLLLLAFCNVYTRSKCN